jgi:hypothetical protein
MVSKRHNRISKLFLDSVIMHLLTLYPIYRAIQKSFYQVGHDSENECRWAAA